MTRNRVLFSVGTILVICCGVGIFLHRSIRIVSAQSSTSTIKPFTGIYILVNFTGDNPQPVSTELRGFMLRSDGANVVSFYRPDPNGNGLKLMPLNIVTNPATRKAMRVLPFIATTVTYSLTQTQANHEIEHFKTSCAGDSAGSVLGYAVVKSREVVSNPIAFGPAYDKIQFDRWLAAALNCMPLRTEITLFKNNKVIQRRSETYLTIKEGEPDSAAFQIPEGYVERTPSEAVLESARRFPNDKLFGDRGKCDLSSLDDVYSSKQNVK